MAGATLVVHPVLAQFCADQLFQILQSALEDGETTVTKAVNQRKTNRTLEKVPTGIIGFDEITSGGLPKGRPTLVCGGPGCGKTLFSMEFLVKGAMEFNEPGVFISFEETADELTKNVRSLGFDLDELIARKKLAIDFVRIERSEIEKPAITIWRDSSSDSATRLIPSAPSASSWIPSKHSSVLYRTKASFALNSGVCSAG
jgi:replicative DNA helicase